MQGVLGRTGVWSVLVMSIGTVLLMCAALLMVVSSASAFEPEYDYKLVRSFGPDGTEASEFLKTGPIAVDQQAGLVYVLDKNAGKIYKFDLEGNPVNWGGTAPYISGNQISGLTFVSCPACSQVAVNSATHVVYVTTGEGTSLRAFAENGEPANFTAGPYAGTNLIEGFGKLEGVAVDSEGFIYASDNTSGVKIYSSSGEAITSFSAATAGNVAVNNDGAVYVDRRGSETVLKYTPSSVPVMSTTTYTAAAAPVSPEGSLTVAIDPSTDDVYLTIVNSPSIPKVAVFSASGAPITTFAGPGEEGEIYIAEGLAIAPITGDHSRVFIGNKPNVGTGPPQVRLFEQIIREPEPPSIEQLAAAEVSSTTASLYARINPNLKVTTYRFEYGLTDCSVSACTSVPAGGATISAGGEGVWVAQGIQGLMPGTEYHYRVVAENDLSPGGPSEEQGFFKTQAAGLEFRLADGRAWEMVSPPDKRSAVLAGSKLGQIQAAANGNGIAYLSGASIEAEPEGSRFEATSILAEREGTNWRSRDISPPNGSVIPPGIGQQGEYKLFSPDLSEAILDPRGASVLSPEASERTPYLRYNAIPSRYRPLVTSKEGFANVPAGTEFGGGNATTSAVTIEDATPDLGHVLLKSTVPLVENAPTTFSIYEWADGQIEPISVLPPGGVEGGAIVEGEAGAAGIGGSLRHAISDDGSRVFWTGPHPNSVGKENHLYMRDTVADESVQIDLVQSGLGGGTVNPVFQGANADGTVVFFTDEQHLTEDASPSGRDLYRCEIVSVSAGCTSLVDISAPIEGSGESTEIQGLVSGLSDDGSKVYFVARGSLDASANPLGLFPVAEEPNLYLWEEDELHFVATLAAEDRPDWGLAPGVPATGYGSGLSAANSPSGRYFSFMSQRNLTEVGPNADNLDVRTGEAVEEVYRYDAITGRLDCVSCAPTGAAPRGDLVGSGNWLVNPRVHWKDHPVAAILPQPETINEGGSNLTIYSPRAVLDNGRVFFNAIDSLVPADSNQQWDVYQYEDLGVGDCTEASDNASVARSGKGCVSLLSSGTGEAEAGFLDASGSGNDVFFLTPASLTATDVDHELDVYDARVGGGSTAVDQPTECTGETCRLPGSQVSEALPNSASFSGPGNLNGSRKCPSGKRSVRRAGKQRCVHRRKHHRHKKHRRRAGRGKGASR